MARPTARSESGYGDTPPSIESPRANKTHAPCREGHPCEEYDVVRTGLKRGEHLKPVLEPYGQVQNEFPAGGYGPDQGLLSGGFTRAPGPDPVDGLPEEVYEVGHQVGGSGKGLGYDDK